MVPRSHIGRRIYRDIRQGIAQSFSRAVQQFCGRAKIPRGPLEQRERRYRSTPSRQARFLFKSLRRFSPLLIFCPNQKHSDQNSNM